MANSRRKVTLEMGELAMAEAVGKLRQSEAVKARKKDAHGLAAQQDATLHIYGAQAELAAAKAMGLYWRGGVNEWKRADIGESVQVRARPRRNGELIVRPGDPDEHVYLLVTGEGPEFELVGWIPGFTAKQEQYLAAPAGRPAAYFVPQSALLSVDQLPRA